uniref:Uncharacterized protein n=1 Tax=Physcomitrium patens TaxID=3218 RepID=A0A2K1IVY4_PHYPA|nr:hypothetical protein PHYPA_025381 [Physcomitrium patens]
MALSIIIVQNKKNLKIIKYVELLDVEYFKDLNLCYIINYYSQTNFNFKDTKLMKEFNF